MGALLPTPHSMIVILYHIRTSWQRISNVVYVYMRGMSYTVGSYCVSPFDVVQW